MLRCLCFLAFVLAVESGSSAPFFKPCPINDDSCAAASARATIPAVASGVPSLGIKALDPMHIDLIKSDQEGLNLVLKDTDVTGLKRCALTGLRKHLSSKGKHAIIIVRCTVTATGSYTMSGKLAVLPVKGQGKYTIRMRNLIMKITTDLVNVTGADGKPHWHVDNWSHTYTVRGADFQFDNLFNGNRALAAPVEEYMKTNWRDVTQVVVSPLVRGIVASSEDALIAVVKAVPIEELDII